MILVEVRCNVGGCWKLLDQVTDAPARDEDWSAYVYLHVCPRHGGGQGSVAKWVAAQKRLSRRHDRVQLGRWVPWSTLRSAVEDAWRTGETTTYTV